VLTSEWIDGISVRDRSGADRRRPRFPKRIANIVIRSSLTNSLRGRLFPTQKVTRENLCRRTQARLVAVDFG